MEVFGDVTAEDDDEELSLSVNNKNNNGDDENNDNEFGNKNDKRNKNKKDKDNIYNWNKGRIDPMNSINTKKLSSSFSQQSEAERIRDLEGLINHDNLYRNSDRLVITLRDQLILEQGGHQKCRKNGKFQYMLVRIWINGGILAIYQWENIHGNIESLDTNYWIFW
ncbi:hypothetical protein Glove_707g56 [Diversispora epigaea]|uniref:Uncharacterized protein n=1 Tax=Diversispora epigaea TaxID=1348612 RepID=A0A397G6D5_9GLOM|nr:hypothetical protein Glove_707g56 [Diversispora epigaea]